MKNSNKFTDFITKKGFYATVFTCLFVVMAIAAVVSIRNIDAVNKLNDNEVALNPTYGDSESQEADVAQASAATEKPLSELLETVKKEREDETGDKDGEIKEDANDAKQPEKDEPEVTVSEKIEEETKEQETEENTQVKEEKPEQETEEEPKDEQEEQEQQEEGQTASADATLNWPLDGAIVMDFSMDRTVYDKTLDQYRTNAGICISAPVGTQVNAAAQGTIESVQNDIRTGYTVVIDHGNGWKTTYGQLQETILVNEGQQVEKGQVIGGVGSPTKYSILLGGHLSFQIDKDSIPQDPKAVLVK